MPWTKKKNAVKADRLEIDHARAQAQELTRAIKERRPVGLSSPPPRMSGAELEDELVGEAPATAQAALVVLPGGKRGDR